MGKEETKIRREHIQVIQTRIWDLGLLVGTGGEYKLGGKMLGGKPVYIFGMKKPAKVQLLEHFLEPCKRFPGNKKS
jgi:hypothetical protein